MHGKSIVITLMTVWLTLGATASVAFADGGMVRFSERRGDRLLITVFTTPTPFRAGPVDVSVLVQDADTGRPLSDVPIVVYAHSIQNTPRKIAAPATTQAASNKLMCAAALDLTEPGWWHVEIVVNGFEQEPPIAFDVEVAEALPPWLHMGPWICWPLVAIGVFAVHQLLVYRRRC
jgi:hypothetical protein